MSNDWISPEILQRFAGSLLHFLWQGAVVAIAAAAGLRLAARKPAAWRHTIAVAAMLLMFTAPLATFIFYAQTGALARWLLQFVAENVAALVRPSPPIAVTVAWMQWIVVAWAVGVAISSIRLVAGWKFSRRLVRVSNEIVPTALISMFENVRSHLGVTKPVRLLINEYVDTPAVLGWLRPVVLFPVTSLTGLNELQLRAVLAHEIAHIRRHDFLVNAVQRCVESILFYHPAVWWISARIRQEREHCCDDVAIQICGDRLLYAQALIELERARTIEPVFATAATGGN